MGAGALLDSVTNVFIRVRSDDGVCGYGEAATWNLFSSETPEGICQVSENLIGPSLAGRDVLDLNGCRSVLDRAIVGNPAAKSAVETALYDLAARSLGVPVYTLLGGLRRHDLGLSYSVSAQDVALEADLVQARYEEGYRIFKLKTGVRDWRTDAARIASLAGRYDDVSIRLDFNCAGDPLAVHRLLGAVADVPIDYVEQPFAPEHHQPLRQLRRSFPVPLCADEGCRTPADARALLADGSYDLISLKAGKLGGYGTVGQIAAAAALHGVYGYAGAFEESRLGTTAALHQMLTLPLLADGCDYYFSLVILDPEQGPHGGFEVRDGRLSLPREPGLGVTVPDSWFD
ncbi:mandelate racemase/muconate lactonizing enzyme family protein [Streptomyces sp. WM6372]|uniref:mandelate racemase/muconate lactonizing enzyme family protein n=1 Tax=Streptomyces sp. WM6372 TaxID=1415555 RepID=UPI00099C9A1B|nr:enolase C-terminal domain-like protein [Streptomyces sp. WM6372]